jgi:hypothetical protein
MLERTDTIKKEVLEPTTFVLAYPAVSLIFIVVLWIVMCSDSNGVQQNPSAGSMFTYLLFASGARGTHGREQNCTQNFGGET